MGKPSIFSKEYEKRMKRRRRNLIIIFLAIIMIVFISAVQLLYNEVNYSEFKKSIQEWIDSDTNNSQKHISNEEESNESENNDQIAENNSDENSKEPLEESIEITLSDGSVVKAIYIDNNGEKSFKSLENSENIIAYDISLSGKQMLIEDKTLVITLYNLDGTNKEVSKNQYVSTNGGVFTKETALQMNAQYLWNSQPKFIDEDKMIFVTNRPYFGSGSLKQYLWITNLTDSEDKVIWDLKGNDIQIGNKEEKGVKITVDGKIYFIDVNGNYIQ